MCFSPKMDTAHRAGFNVSGAPMNTKDLDRLKAETSAWLRKNSPGTKRKRARGPKKNGYRHPRDHIMGQFCPVSIKEFVHEYRHFSGCECLLVPGAKPGVPAKVSFCGRQIAASRYMALLTHGAPKSEEEVARHLCGNGHLSCVNPSHLSWGSLGQNLADANRHRALGDDATEQDKIHAVTPN